MRRRDEGVTANRRYARSIASVASFTLGLVLVVLIGYLCAVAVVPGLKMTEFNWISWIGEPGSWPTAVVVFALFVTVVALRWFVRRTWPLGSSTIVLAAMAAAALALGLASYWRCHGDQMPFVGPLASTLALFVGSTDNPVDPAIAACRDMPVALDIARLIAISTLLTAAVVTGIGLLRAQIDRLAVRMARHVTVVVGIDDDSVSMVAAIARGSTPGAVLVVVTHDANRDCVRAARGVGARILEMNLRESSDLGSLRIWRKLSRLYLLSDEPELNFRRLAEINRAREQTFRSESRSHRVRIPLTVRIDDPWQAEIWRRRFLGDTRNLWAPDAIGKYELTASRIASDVLERSPIPRTVYLCGSSVLAFALCAEFAQLAREHAEVAYQAEVVRRARGVDVPTVRNGQGEIVEVPRLCVVASDAAGFVQDHLIRQHRLAPDASGVQVDLIEAEPTIECVFGLVEGTGSPSAVILTADSDPSIGTRLATRLPHVPIYQATGSTSVHTSRTAVGELVAMPISLVVDDHLPQDTWERGARLLHELYSVGADSTLPASRPWPDLDPFYRESNRRAVLNILWMVEVKGGATWNSLESDDGRRLPADFAHRSPVDQAAALGFGTQAFDRMLEHEHNDWLRHLRAEGWRAGSPPGAESPEQSRARKIEDHRNRVHRGMVEWSEVITRPDLRLRAEENLVFLLRVMRVVGFCSIPRKDAAAAVREPGGLESAAVEPRTHLQ